MPILCFLACCKPFLRFLIKTVHENYKASPGPSSLALKALKISFN